MKEFIGTNVTFKSRVHWIVKLSLWSWKTKILIMKKSGEKKKKAELLPLHLTRFLSIQKLHNLWLPNASVLPEKKHFSFTSSLIVHDTVFLLGPFSMKPKRIFDLNATLSQGHIRAPVWRGSSAKTLISYLKCFQASVYLYELMLLRHLL